MFLEVLFFCSALLAVGGAFAMLITKNIMHSCIFLLANLIGVAGLYVTLGADFVAATQVMVYVGGVVILMVFAVMLTGGTDFKSKAQQLLGLIPSMGNKWSYGIGILTVLVFLSSLTQLFRNIFSQNQVSELSPFKSTVEDIGLLLLSDHILAFEISSVLLLGALVGAAIIARPRNNVTEVEKK